MQQWWAGDVRRLSCRRSTARAPGQRWGCGALRFGCCARTGAGSVTSGTGASASTGTSTSTDIVAISDSVVAIARPRQLARQPSTLEPRTQFVSRLCGDLRCMHQADGHAPTHVLGDLASLGFIVHDLVLSLARLVAQRALGATMPRPALAVQRSQLQVSIGDLRGRQLRVILPVEERGPAPLRAAFHHAVGQALRVWAHSGGADAHGWGRPAIGAHVGVAKLQ